MNNFMCHIYNVIEKKYRLLALGESCTKIKCVLAILQIGTLNYIYYIHVPIYMQNKVIRSFYLRGVINSTNDVSFDNVFYYN